MKKTMKNKINNIWLILLILISSCKKDEIITLPTLTTLEITNITETSAYTGGAITDNGNGAIIERGVCWSSTLLEPVISGNKTNDGLGDGEFTSLINGLTPGTTYYVRAYATNSFGTGYGNTVLFKSTATLPTVTTSQIDLIMQNTAQCGGSITSDNNTLIIDRGVCWSIEPLPDTLDDKTNDGTGSGEFISAINGLMANTTYHVRAYATNNEGGTAYGADLVFKTKAELPNLTTDEMSLLTQTTAQSGGNITSDGGVSIISRGVCWSIETLPTILNNKTIDGQGIGMFASEISILSTNTTYYVRAYATNDEGSTSYGNEQSFTTLPENIEYPITSLYGENILYIPLTQIQANTDYSLAAILPENTNIIVKISGGSWTYQLGTNSNWDITVFDQNSNSQFFTSILDGRECDLKIIFSQGTVTIEYFENGADTPTKTKQLIIE